MDEDEVVGVQVSTQGDTMLIVSENGMGKRTDIDEYTVQHRGGKGVKCYKITEKTGNVVGAKAVDDSREVMLITTEGIIIRLQCSDISNLGRITSGVKLINLDEGIKVATIAKVRKQPADEDGKDAEGFEEDTYINVAVSLRLIFRFYCFICVFFKALCILTIFISRLLPYFGNCCYFNSFIKVNKFNT